MSVRTAKALWEGTLKEGKGKFEVGSKTLQSAYTFATRFENEKGTNPEELVGAAHAACYSMFLSALLSGKNLKPQSIDTTATVTLEKDEIGPNISSIHLECQAQVDGISEEDFLKLTEDAKAKCPISRLYAKGTNITLSAKLLVANLA